MQQWNKNQNCQKWNLVTNIVGGIKPNSKSTCCDHWSTHKNVAYKNTAVTNITLGAIAQQLDSLWPVYISIIKCLVTNRQCWGYKDPTAILFAVTTCLQSTICNLHPAPNDLHVPISLLYDLYIFDHGRVTNWKLGATKPNNKNTCCDNLPCSPFSPNQT